MTGSSGLVGAEVVDYFSRLGAEVHGIDNNMRRDFFGPGGDTLPSLGRLRAEHPRFRHHALDVRDREGVCQCVEAVRPTLVVHAAGQPSHDLAAQRPFDDFDVNATGTLNLLEAVRRHAPGAAFVHLSTNKVYGDGPNRLPLAELPTRWDYADPACADGIPESFPVDQCMHSLFGASKLAADVLVQEYGRYFGIATCCLRGGCLTGPFHAGVELHGFLSYLVKTAVEGRTYRIYGYQGKQVRDNLHAFDIARLVHLFAERPRVAEVYNLGGGRGNSCSILEAFEHVRALTGREVRHEYVDAPRAGDHVCYISDLAKLKAHYPEWSVSRGLPAIFEEIHRSARERQEAA
ncbi:MAG TPA: NAD-dependent epimerase/dehydratase family protein [Longimicrobium sp.]